MNGLDKKTEETITRAQNARLEPANDIFDEPCPECLGWGFRLGTDTEDHFGELCSRGCDIHRPMNQSEVAELQRSHDARNGKISRCL
jgi:hypothetical protein